MQLRNGIIIIAQAALLHAATPATAGDVGMAILQGLSEGLSNYSKAREEEARERRDGALRGVAAQTA